MSGYPKGGGPRMVSIQPVLLPKRKATDEELRAQAKALWFQGLDPPDLKRCQAESLEHEPFRIGSPKRWERCDRVPSVMLIEPKITVGKPTMDDPRPKRTRGAMAVCRSCAGVCKTKDPEILHTPTAPFKAALKIGGWEAVKDMIYGFKS